MFFYVNTYLIFSFIIIQILYPVAILFGIYNCLGIVTINMSSVVAGMWQICAGFLVMCLEAPCCCLFIDHVQVLANKADSRPYWNRAVLYCL